MTIDCRYWLVLVGLFLAPGVIISDDDSSRKPTVKIGAEKLLKEVLANPKAAAAKYEGKVIAVSGPALMTTYHAQQLHDGKNQLSIIAGQKTPKDVGFNLFVEGELAPGLAAKAWMLALGQKIEMIGKVTSVKEDRVTMEDCTYRELEKITLPRITAKNLVAAYLKDPRRADATYGSGNKSKQMFLTGVIREILGGDVRTLVLEPPGKLNVHVNAVSSKEAEGLKKGDTVTLKADCRGVGTFKNADKILCTGIILKDDEVPKKQK
jgi:hypothetical protein